jgi:hypothetical protein
MICFLQTLRFCIKLLVRNIPSSSPSLFSLKPVEELEAVGIDIVADDVLHNFVTKDSQLMRDTVPWRGAREKDPIFLQMLIEATTHVGDIVLDCTTATGMMFFSQPLLIQSSNFNCLFFS